jgi:hypothetical protein
MIAFRCPGVRMQRDYFSIMKIIILITAALKLQVDVPQWLLSNPNGPLRKEQEQRLLLELRTAKNAKQPAVALLSTMYSRQQADKPALQSAASDLLQRLELLRSEIPGAGPYMVWLAIVSAGE